MKARGIGTWSFPSQLALKALVDFIQELVYFQSTKKNMLILVIFKKRKEIPTSKMIFYAPLVKII